ncbi:hypothetical protein RFI_07000 [Reticulomyxa filosa]|uniref:Phosphoglycerate mutase family protein n=1 Tax=Reticulomyxa filosa TaxID=46433 RepID=X6NVR5_RETFI|nr:hypothetical protein RFI_07000 [Reticulomyxa filosa]|eukprot:ETO30116.1 hypothetical protein RFI_07000 [Reticulomyxa filosa]
MPDFKIVNLELCMPHEVWWCTGEQKDDIVENDGLNSNGSVVKESKAQIHERIKQFKDFIVNQREEDNILLVGHSRWFRELVGSKEKLNNCEMMRVVVDKKTGDVISYQVVNFKLHTNFDSFTQNSTSD